MALSRCALRLLRLHEVWWLVTPQNPLKPVAGMTRLGHRLARARAVARQPRIRVTDIEARLGTVYTIDTLRALKARYPAAHLVWLMGADNLVQIVRWRDWRAIFAELPVAVFNRPSYAEQALGGDAARCFARQRIDPRQAAQLAYRRPPAWVFVDSPRNPISASAIRAGAAPAAPDPRTGGSRRIRP